MTPNDSNGNGFRKKVNEIVVEHATFAGWAFDVFLLAAILLSVVVICLETVPELLPYQKWFFWAEIGFTILFGLEYLTRLWCADSALGYAKSFWGIVDLLAVLPGLIGGLAWGMGLFTPEQIASGTGSFAIVRSLRLLRAFRILKIGILERESYALADAIWRARAAIVVFLSTVMIIVIIAGTVMYEIEGIQSENGKSQFNSIPDGIYWAIVTMTTVGYGDVVPQTVMGRLVSSVLILIGYSLIIVPTGFVSAEVVKRRSNPKDERREIATTLCNNCGLRFHDADAKFCKHCSQPLARN